MMSEVVKVLCNGQMEASMKENGRKVFNTVLEKSRSLMKVLNKDYLRIMFLSDKRTKVR